MSRIIDNQRCYKIPKDKLDLFLVKLSMSSTSHVHFEAEYIFENGDVYDVVVNTFGHYLYMERGIDEFAEMLAHDTGI